MAKPGGGKGKKVLNIYKHEVLSTLMKNVLKVTELWHGESSGCDFSDVDIQRRSHFSECQDNLFLQITTCMVSVCKGGTLMTKQKPQ